jgi:hypothetical protein
MKHDRHWTPYADERDGIARWYDTLELLADWTLLTTALAVGIALGMLGWSEMDRALHPAEYGVEAE